MKMRRIAAAIAAVAMMMPVTGYYAPAMNEVSMTAHASLSKEQQEFVKRQIEHTFCYFEDLTCTGGYYQSAYTIIKPNAATTTITTSPTTKEKSIKAPQDEYGYYRNYDRENQKLSDDVNTGEEGYVHIYYTFNHSDSTRLGTPLLYWDRHIEIVKNLNIRYAGATYFGGKTAEEYYRRYIETDDHWVLEGVASSADDPRTTIVGVIGYGDFKDISKAEVKTVVPETVKTIALSKVTAPEKEYIKQGRSFQVESFVSPTVEVVQIGTTSEYGVQVSWKNSIQTYSLQKNNEAIAKTCVPSQNLESLNDKQDFFIHIVKDNACWELTESKQTSYTTNASDVDNTDWYEIYNGGEVFKHGYWTTVEAGSVVGGDESAEKHWFYTVDTYEHACKGHDAENSVEKLSVSSAGFSGITMNIYPVEGTDFAYADSVTIYSTSLNSEAKPLAIATINASKEHQEISFDYDDRYGYMAHWHYGDPRMKGGTKDKYYLYNPQKRIWELFADGNPHATQAELTKTIQIDSERFHNILPENIVQSLKSINIYKNDELIKTISKAEFESGSVTFDMNKMAYEIYNWKAEIEESNTANQTSLTLEGRFLCDIPYVTNRSITGTVKAAFSGLSEGYTADTEFVPYIGLGKIKTIPNSSAAGSDLGQYDLTGHGTCYLITNHPKDATETYLGRLYAEGFSASDFDNGCYFVKDYDSRYDYFLKIAKTPEEKDWVYFKWINGSWVFRVDTSETSAVKTSLAMPMLLDYEFDVAGASVYATDASYLDANTTENFESGRCDIASFSRNDILNGNTEFMLETNPYNGKNIIVSFESYPETDYNNFEIQSSEIKSYDKQTISRCFQYIGIDPVYFTDVYHYSDLNTSRKAYRNQPSDTYIAWWVEPITTGTVWISIPCYFQDDIAMYYLPPTSDETKATGNMLTANAAEESLEYKENFELKGMKYKPEIFFDNEAIALPEGHYRVENRTTGFVDEFDIDFSGVNKNAVGKTGRINGTNKFLELNLQTPVEEHSCKVYNLNGEIIGEKNNFTGAIKVIGDLPVSFSKLQQATPYAKYEIRNGVANSINPESVTVETGYVAIEKGALVKVEDTTPIGDINLDGEANTLDIVVSQKYLLNQGSLNTAKYICADINKDGEVDVFDLGLLKKIVLEK